MDVQWITSLIERERALLGAMLVQLNSVSRALVDRNDPCSAKGRLDERDARTMFEAVADRLRADEERLRTLSQHVADGNGEPA